MPQCDCILMSDAELSLPVVVVVVVVNMHRCGGLALEQRESFWSMRHQHAANSSAQAAVAAAVTIIFSHILPK